jgi:UDP-N-acetylglucosamine 1-carboxyvinyltransferase
MLVIAGLRAEGVTEVSDAYHIDRGYPDFLSQMRALGADIERLTVDEDDLSLAL